MNLTKKILLSFVFLLMGLPIIQAQSNAIPDQFCINQQEYRLYSLINEYRARFALDPIPLSKSLSYVAKTHAHDLAENYPMGEDCNMHSWSNKGDWKAFCFPADQDRKNDIKDKAKELTLYPGKAWEITYWDNTELDLNMVLEFWRSIPLSANMMTNTEKWADAQWKSMGVAIEKGYVLIWFGKEVDVEISTLICETGEKIMNTAIPKELIVPAQTKIQELHSGSKAFYVIIGSYNKKEDANAAVDSYHQMGYPHAVIVEEQGKIRVAIDSFKEEASAQAAIAKYRDKFQGAWVFSK